jgi:hypothetical protein
MKSRIYYYLIGVSCVLVSTFANAAYNIDYDQIPYTTQADLLGCKEAEGNAKKFVLESKILLNKKFMPAGLDNKNLEAFYKASIEFQIKHLMGFFKNTKDNGLNAALYAYRGPVKILKIGEVNYDIAMPVDNYLPQDRGEGTEYVRNALKIGKTEVSDKAVEIAYSVELMVSDCSIGGFFSGPKISLPLDPYLSLWLENKSKRQPRVLGPSKIASASNCSSYEITLFGNNNVSWFFWSPVTKYGEKNCNIENDKTLITPKIGQIEIVPRSPKLKKDFFQNKKAFNFAVMFGEIDSTSGYFAKVNYAWMKKIITENLSACLKTTIVPECLTLWNPAVGAQEDNKYHEPGVYSFLIFLKHLSTQVKLASFQIEQSPVDMALQIKGVLRDAGTPIEVAVHMGRTSLDYGPAAPSSYVKFTHDAFKEADSIAYVGHAGVGTNLNIKILEELWNRDHLPSIKRIGPIWIGLYNCEGVSYFGFDLDKIFQKNKVKAIETFTSGTMSGPEFPLLHLLTLNNVFSGREVKIKDIFRLEYSGREFIAETWLEEKAPKQSELTLPR